MRDHDRKDVKKRSEIHGLETNESFKNILEEE